jgi:hypothetical protein
VSILAELLADSNFVSLLLDNVASMHQRAGVAKAPKWTQGHIKLRRESERYTSKRKFWTAIGVDMGFGSRIHRGLLTPTFAAAARIEEATDGRVKVRDWALKAEPPIEAAV